MNIILSFIVVFTATFLHATQNLTDTSLIEKKELKNYLIGEKIFKKVCKKTTNLQNYKELNQCKTLKDKQLQSLFIYLSKEKINDDIIEVTKGDKCPICGMFVYKYQKWVAQIFYKNSHYTFDGVKDMMKYYFIHKENRDDISKILVTDYYSQKAIDAQEAYFVIGSDVYGPMGDELIPFKSEREAKIFSEDHKAIKILNFKDIKKMEVYKLDE